MKLKYAKPEIREMGKPVIIGCPCNHGGSAGPQSCTSGYDTSFYPPVGECRNGGFASAQGCHCGGNPGFEQPKCFYGSRNY